MGIRTSGHSRGQGRLWALLLVGLLVLAACSSRADVSTQPKTVPAHLTVESPSTPSSTLASTPAGTSVHAADPYASDGRLTVVVARRVRGSCWSTSIAAPGARSYRCFSGNTILDPCFASPTSAPPGTLACQAAPWSPAISLRLTKPLPAADATGAGRIWALTLSNGVRCVAATGTVVFVAGHNLSDTCPGGYAAQIDNPAAHVMTALYGRPGDTQLRQLAVRAVWRA